MLKGSCVLVSLQVRKAGLALGGEHVDLGAAIGIDQREALVVGATMRHRPKPVEDHVPVLTVRAR